MQRGKLSRLAQINFTKGLCMKAHTSTEIATCDFTMTHNVKLRILIDKIMVSTVVGAPKLKQQYIIIDGNVMFSCIGISFL